MGFQTIPIDFDSSDSIKMVKQKIANKEICTPDQQRLFSNRIELNDHHTLSTYNIQKEDTLLLVVRKRVGGLSDEEGGSENENSSHGMPIIR